MQYFLEQLVGLANLKEEVYLWQHQLVCLHVLHLLGLINLVPDHHLPTLFDFLFPFLIDAEHINLLYSYSCFSPASHVLVNAFWGTWIQKFVFVSNTSHKCEAFVFYCNSSSMNSGKVNILKILG
jgi:hypothetical protein